MARKAVVHLVNRLKEPYGFTCCGWAVRRIVRVTDDGFLVKRRAITDRPEEVTCGRCKKTKRHAVLEANDG